MSRSSEAACYCGFAPLGMDQALCFQISKMNIHSTETWTQKHSPDGIISKPSRRSTLFHKTAMYFTPVNAGILGDYG